MTSVCVRQLKRCYLDADIVELEQSLDSWGYVLSVMRAPRKFQNLKLT